MPARAGNVPGPVRGEHLVRQAQGWGGEQVHLADIGPDHAPALFDRVTGDRHAIGQRGLLALDRDGGALAGAAIAKPVVPALELLALDGATFRKCRAAVWTAIDEQMGLARGVAPQRQLFAQSFDADGLAVAQVGRLVDRIPAVAQAELQSSVDRRGPPRGLVQDGKTVVATGEALVARALSASRA